MRRSKEERAADLEARARRARAEAKGLDDEDVRRVLRIHDIATSLGDMELPAKTAVDKIRTTSLDLLALLGAPL